MTLARPFPDGTVPALIVTGACLAAGLGVALANAPREAWLLLLLAMAALGLVVAVQRGLVSPAAVLLVALLSANYNVIVNYNAFVAGALPVARLITPVATAGLCLVAVQQAASLRARSVAFRFGAADAIVGLLLFAATLALLHGLLAGNPRSYVLGDFGQLLQVGAAYAAVRLFWLNNGTEAMRSLIFLLCLSWGLRAAAEFAMPSQRGVWTIVLEGETLFRRTDTLGPLTIPFMLAFGLSERRPATRLVILACLSLVALQNVFGFTRAHYLALSLVLPITLLAALGSGEVRHRAVLLVYATLLVALLLAAAVPAAHHWARQTGERFLETFDADTQSRLHREAETRLVLRQIENDPVVGRGLGFVYDGVDPFTFRRVPAHFIHNDYLALWLRGGLPLLLSWGLLLGYAVLRGFARGDSSALGPLVAAGAASGLLAEAIAAVPSGSAFGYIAGPVLALLVVVATPAAREARSVTRERILVTRDSISRTA